MTKKIRVSIMSIDKNNKKQIQAALDRLGVEAYESPIVKSDLEGQQIYGRINLFDFPNKKNKTLIKKYGVGNMWR